MSGGHFDYKEHSLLDIIDKIQEIIDINDCNDLNSDGEKIGRHYSPEIIEKFKTSIRYIKNTYEMIHDIDYLISGDHAEDSFLEQWSQKVNIEEKIYYVQSGKGYVCDKETMEMTSSISDALLFTFYEAMYLSSLLEQCGMSSKIVVKK